MEEDILLKQRQLNCTHEKEKLYTQRQFDILNGFELNFVRCINCHKVVELEARKIAK